MCVDFYLFFSFKILHVFQFSETKKPPKPPVAAVADWLCSHIHHSDHSRRPAAQPGCAQPTCGPNSHRELTNHPPYHHEKKREKKNILNHPSVNSS